MILLYFYSHNPVATLVTDRKLLQVSCGRSLFDSRSFYCSGHNRTSACQHGRETPLSMTALQGFGYYRKTISFMWCWTLVLPATVPDLYCGSSHYLTLLILTLTHIYTNINHRN